MDYAELLMSMQRFLEMSLGCMLPQPLLIKCSPENWSSPGNFYADTLEYRTTFWTPLLLEAAYYFYVHSSHIRLY